MHMNGEWVGIVFWIAIVAITLINVWGKRTAERERQLTLRAAIERGQQLDPAMLEKLTALQTRSSSPFGLLIAGVVVLSTGVGLALLGLFVGAHDADTYNGTIGAGLLVGMVGVGLCAGYWLRRRFDVAAPQPPSLPPSDPAA